MPMGKQVKSLSLQNSIVAFSLTAEVDGGLVLKCQKTPERNRCVVVPYASCNIIQVILFKAELFTVHFG